MNSREKRVVAVLLFEFVVFCLVFMVCVGVSVALAFSDGSVFGTPEFGSRIDGGVWAGVFFGLIATIGSVTFLAEKKVC